MKAFKERVLCPEGAIHHPGDGELCLAGTRKTILEDIKNWAEDFNMPPIYWLNGSAWVGKSTIARTIAESLSKNEQLGASFFCSRKEEDLSNPKLIFPTLAVQLAHKYPLFKSKFIQAIRHNPEVGHGSLEAQVKQLIIGPLEQSCIQGTVVVIDALDECKDKEAVSQILSVLKALMFEIRKIKLKIFIASRPGPRLPKGFPDFDSGEVKIFSLHEVESREVEEDMTLFFRDKLSEPRRGIMDLPVEWLAQGDLDKLGKHAEGLFIYAMAMVSRLFSNGPGVGAAYYFEPKQENYISKAQMTDGKSICSLYTSAFEGFFGSFIPETCSRVLGGLICAQYPISPSTMAELLDLDVEFVRFQLESVESFVILQKDNNHPVRPFHKSFATFLTNLTDPPYLGWDNKRFFLSPPTHHKNLLIGCLKLMNAKLKEGMRKPPDAVTNRGVEGGTENYINGALEYACRSWYHHLTVTMETVSLSEIQQDLRLFLNKLPHCEEVLRVLGAKVVSGQGEAALSKAIAINLARVGVVTPLNAQPEPVLTHTSFSAGNPLGDIEI